MNSLMFNEASYSAEAARKQILSNNAAVNALSQELKQSPPTFVVTCARGSSDHAATYAKYLIENRLGYAVSSAAPSVNSVYQNTLNLRGALFIAISQSGKSPDLIEQASQAKENGARVVALVNDAESPLAELADYLLPLHAGPERSVAATKSYICSLVAIYHLVAMWSDCDSMIEQLDKIPTYLEKAWEIDWSLCSGQLQSTQNMFVIGRGYGFAIAQEAALKFKETCGIHAEAYSSAEARHGPMAIVKDGFPVLVFSQNDETQIGIFEMASDFEARGAKVLHAASDGTIAENLPALEGIPPQIAPMTIILSFYRMLNTLSISRGYDPDKPPHLKKVTETL